MLGLNFAITGAMAGEPVPSPMLATLQQRVVENPSHADSWRCLAKIHQREGRIPEAIESLHRALSIDPESVASHHDLGQILASQGDHETATVHFANVLRLAPDSGYARRLIEQGQIPESIKTELIQDGQPVTAVGYQIQTFDGSEAFQRQLEEIESDEQVTSSRIRAFVEAGVLYNSNVSLTPISRQLDNADASSFQGFLSPELEYLLVDRPLTRSGPLARGYFAINESTQSEYDLAAFQGGWFLERDSTAFGWDWLSRVDYVYSLDLQGGDRFADRHSLNLSATSFLNDGDLLYLFGSINTSDFADDGTIPSIDSLDGPGFITGITRYFQLSREYLRSIRIGGDLSSADTEGADYRFFGAGIHGGLQIALNEQWSLEPETGIGFRVYDDFTGTVSRDELLLRVGASLQRRMSDRFTLALVVNHDRFASDNADFDAERTEGGITLRWMY